MFLIKLFNLYDETNPFKLQLAQHISAIRLLTKIARLSEDFINKPTIKRIQHPLFITEILDFEKKIIWNKKKQCIYTTVNQYLIKYKIFKRRTKSLRHARPPPPTRLAAALKLLAFFFCSFPLRQPWALKPICWVSCNKAISDIRHFETLWGSTCYRRNGSLRETPKKKFFFSGPATKAFLGNHPLRGSTNEK